MGVGKGWRYGLFFLVILLTACTDVWNNPYPEADSGKNILYNAFVERPKHLDPVQSYSSNEITFTAQIYQPPLQYHYLKRPFTLIPQTALSMPVVRYYNANDEQLPANAASAEIHYSVYEISIKPGILYQPHPAFAKDVQANLLYHALTVQDTQSVYKLSDFEHSGTRSWLQQITYTKSNDWHIPDCIHPFTV
jgi:oligopeptide transport system substrate-binding protein